MERQEILEKIKKARSSGKDKEHLENLKLQLKQLNNKTNVSSVNQTFDPKLNLETFRVTIYFQNGESIIDNIVQDLQRNTSVAYLKKTIEEKHNIPSRRQTLLINNEICSDQDTLISRGTKRENTFVVFTHETNNEKQTGKNDDNKNLTKANSPNNETLRLTIKIIRQDYDEEGHLYDLKPSTTVNFLNTMMQRRFSFPSRSQQWVISGQAASDNDTLQMYNVQNGDIIVLVIKNPSPEKSTEANFEYGQDRFDKLGWKCTFCTWVNKPLRPGCEQCSSDRPDDYIIPKYEELTEEDKMLLEKLEIEDNQFLSYQQDELERNEREKQKNLTELLNTDIAHLVENKEVFECPVCFCEIDPGDGITIRECLHQCCKDCLVESIKHSPTIPVICPSDADNCQGTLIEREVKALMDENGFAAYLKKGIQTAEQQEQNSYHCKTSDCAGWCIYEDEVNQYTCEVCKKINCLVCKAIHEQQTCKEYQEDIKIKAQHDENAKATQDAFEKMIEDGEAMYCPGCKIILQKKDGCDWMCCVMCKIEICWATKKPRWGPKGRGDRSGGCGCNWPTKCAPTCRYCH